jgi:hypothetical protein
MQAKWTIRVATGLVAGMMLASGPPARGAELITLNNGFDLRCNRHQAMGAKVRLYLGAGEANFVDVDAGQIVSLDMVPDPPPAATEKLQPITAVRAELTQADLRQLLVRAGTEQNLSVDLLASVVRAESGGHARAVSRAGAQGLMQLMPKTAAGLGVEDSFEPGQNVHGGSIYLNSLLLKYHDNLALALAAYNAGPAAVDRWHGIPPYRETRAYVARVIHEFNRSYAAHRPAIAGTARTADRASGRAADGTDAAAAAESASRTVGHSTLVARAGAAGTDNE